MSGGLPSRLAEIARTTVLLVASDFDGTLAPLVPDPERAEAYPGAVEALVALARLERTHAAIISGRGRALLSRLTGGPPGVHLVGSHGAEDDLATRESPPAGLLEALAAEMDAIAARAPGLEVERKPLAVALHCRRAGDADAAAAVDAVLRGPGARAGVTVRHGSRVVEVCVSSADKGAALSRLRAHVGATAAVFIGDDLTDLDALRTLGPRDLGVCVGTGLGEGFPRVADVRAVVALLERLVVLRAGE
ncbi:MAG: trehalose-phosphatase [Phycisphaerales bacterium]|nr:trehalose-phosphatase [Phycisphaerales bacterium]